MQNKLFKRLLPAALLAGALLWGVRPLHVQNAEMAPSILAGDWVLWLPLSPRAGDVVLLSDPSEPERRVLRRVVGLPGQQVELSSPGLAVDGRPWRWREMHRAEGWVAYSEQDTWLIQTADRSFDEAKVSLQAGEGLVLLADDRDGPVDSRLWGPIDADHVHGRVWLRIGPSNPWRGPLGLGAQDGPWIPPSKQAAP